jgi:hypothetical protein
MADTAPQPKKRITKGDLEVKHRRNEIASVMGELGMNQSDFRVSGSRITDLRPGATSGDWFDFGDLSVQHYEIYRVSFVLSDYEHPTHQDVVSFSSCLNHFRSWFRHLEAQRRLEAEFERIPDLLDEFFKYAGRGPFPQSTSDDDNLPFTPEDCRRIEIALEKLDAHVRAQSILNKVQSAYLADQIMYLMSASNRVGRKDWLNIVIGVVAGLVVNGIYAPDRANALIWGVVKEFDGLLHVLGTLKLTHG